jgi:hypothetical protein
MNEFRIGGIDVWHNDLNSKNWSKNYNYDSFSKWIDKHLREDLPDDVVSINFNLYEGADNTYDIEIIGSDEFDEDNSDWVCSEVFTTRDDMFYIQRISDIDEYSAPI